MDNNLFINENANYGYLAATISCIGDGIISTSIDGKIVFLNNAAAELTGWKVEEAIGKKLYEVLPIQNDREANTIDIFESAVSKGTKAGLKRDAFIITKDGDKKYISASCAPNIDQNNSIIGTVIAFRDISRIKNMNEELLEERNNFRAIFESSPLGIAIVDSDIVVKEANSTFLKLFERSYEQTINKRIGNLLLCINNYDDERGCGYTEACKECNIRQTVHKVLDDKMTHTKKGIKYVHNVNNKEESPWLNINFVPTSLSGQENVMLVIEDITERKRIENEIKESKIKYQSLFMNMNSAFAYFQNLVDENNVIQDLEVIEVNSKFEELFDIKQKDIQGKKLSQIFKNFFVEYKEDICKTVEESKSEDRAVKIPEYFDPTFGRWFSISTYRSTEGVNAAIISDITQRKNAESELRKAKEEAENADMAKSQFLANMSHEIRTPLNGMVGMLDLTLQSALSCDQKDNLNIARSCANSLLKVINDILDFSKMEAGKLTIENIIFNLKELIEETTRVHIIRAEEKGIELNYKFSSGLPDNVIGDPSRLKQVLNNLISNAIKFTETGDVTVSVKRYARQEDVVELLFSVADSGIGVPKDKVDLLFKSFSQVDSSYTRKFGGTGLGLVISKQLVEMMGGKIWVESEEDKGSTFFFTVKMGIGHKGKIGANEINDIVQEIKQKSELKILFVEDDKINQMVVDNYLKLKGDKVSFANNGLEALEILEKESFDVILMDIQMPIMDGLQATVEIRKREQLTGMHTPIIAVTAYALKGDKEKFLSMGMDGYISKPIDSKLLFQMLDKFGNAVMVSPKKKVIEVETRSKADAYADADADADAINGVSNGNAMIDIFNQSDKIINDEEIVIKIMDDIAKQLILLKKAIDIKNFTSVEGAAHHIKALATRIDVPMVKNYAFKVELAARRKSSDDAKEAFGILELEFFKLKMKK
jgi:PAS domain S-box-containing protein